MSVTLICNPASAGRANTISRWLVHANGIAQAQALRCRRDREERAALQLGARSQLRRQLEAAPLDFVLDHKCLGVGLALAAIGRDAAIDQGQRQNRRHQGVARCGCLDQDTGRQPGIADQTHSPSLFHGFDVSRRLALKLIWLRYLALACG